MQKCLNDTCQLWQQLTTLFKSLKPQYLRSKSLLAPNEIKDSRVVSQHLRKMLNTPQQLTRNSQNKSSFNYYDTGQTKYQLTIPRILLNHRLKQKGKDESFKNYFQILKLQKRRFFFSNKRSLTKEEIVGEWRVDFYYLFSRRRKLWSQWTITENIWVGCCEFATRLIKKIHSKTWGWVFLEKEEDFSLNPRLVGPTVFFEEMNSFKERRIFMFLNTN